MKTNLILHADQKYIVEFVLWGHCSEKRLLYNYTLLGLYTQQRLWCSFKEPKSEFEQDPQVSLKPTVSFRRIFL